MSKKERQVRVSFSYDRLWEQKLSQVYRLLIPPSQQVDFTEQVFEELIEQTSVNENSSDLYESLVRSAEGQ